MKTFLILALAIPHFALAQSKNLSCEKGNIKIEIQESKMGSIKYKYQDTLRRASAEFNKSSYTFNGDEEGDMISLELYPTAPITYTAVIEDYGSLLETNPGDKGFPLLLMIEDRMTGEEHIQISCDILK